MPNSPAHLTERTLEEIAEGMLTGSEGARAREHLQGCARCRAEVEAYKVLFANLSNLPRFAPSENFADGVMARVRIMPETDPLYARMVKWMPDTRRGWALLAASVMAPAAPVLVLIAWVLSQPMVTFGGLWQMGTTWLAELAVVASGYLMQWGMTLGVVDAAGSIYEVVAGIPSATLVTAAAVLAVATPLSAWFLVRLVRSPMRKVTYAN